MIGDSQIYIYNKQPVVNILKTLDDSNNMFPMTIGRF